MRRSCQTIHFHFPSCCCLEPVSFDSTSRSINILCTRLSFICTAQYFFLTEIPLPCPLYIYFFFYHAHIMAEKIRLVCIYSRIPYNKVTRSDAHNRDITIVEKCITLYWCSFYIIHIYYIYLALFHFVTVRCIVSLHFIQFRSVRNLKKLMYKN